MRGGGGGQVSGMNKSLDLEGRRLVLKSSSIMLFFFFLSLVKFFPLSELPFPHL